MPQGKRSHGSRHLCHRRRSNCAVHADVDLESFEAFGAGSGPALVESEEEDGEDGAHSASRAVRCALERKPPPPNKPGLYARHYCYKRGRHGLGRRTKRTSVIECGGLLGLASARSSRPFNF